MKEDVLDVLLYIFERYQDDEVVPLQDTDHLIKELENVGFTNGEIERALDWLDGLLETASENFAPTPANQRSQRHYSEPELQALNVECRGFIQSLENLGVLDTHTREMVIDRVLALANDDEEISTERLKWVVMMVLFNMPGRESEFAWLETLELEHHLH